jgi:hypothetical protein
MMTFIELAPGPSDPPEPFGHRPVAQWIGDAAAATFTC